MTESGIIIDIVLASIGIAIIAYHAYRGFAYILIKSLSSIASLFLSLLLAGKLIPLFEKIFESRGESTPIPVVLWMISFAVLFFSFFFLIRFVGRALFAILEKLTLVKTVDRLLGALVGIILAYFALMFSSIAINALGNIWWEDEGSRSVIADFFTKYSIFGFFK